MGNTQSKRSNRHSIVKTSKDSSSVHQDLSLTSTANSVHADTPTSSKASPSATNRRISHSITKARLCTNRLSLPPSPTESDFNHLREAKPTADTRTIHGRKYQNINKKYILPSDEQEQDRLVQVHFIYKYIFKDNFSPPIRDLLSGNQQCSQSSGCIKRNQLPPRVLDVACGNGVWILEMATEFPQTDFYGIDFCALYPSAIKPSNTFFSKVNVLDRKGLPFPDGYFDYVHMRQVYSCFSESDWINIVKEIKRVTKPGGYVEFRDIDPIPKDIGPLTKELFKPYTKAMKEEYDVDVCWSKCMYDYLRNVGGMIDMHRSVCALRFGSVEGPIGDMIHNSLRTGLESYRLFFLNTTQLSDAEFDTLSEQVVEENIKLRSFFEYYLCWGRKPLVFEHNDVTKRYSFPLDNETKHNEPRPMCRNASCSASQLDIISRQADHFDGHFMSKHSHFVWDNSKNNESKGDVTSLGSDNVSDIDQFVEGFED